MTYRDTLFSTLTTNINKWIFDEKVAKVFPDMIRRSIPGYFNIISIIGMLIKKFIKPGMQIYDLGCSIGSIPLPMYHILCQKNCKIIAVDNSSAMIKHFKYNVNRYKNLTSLILLEEDIRNIEIQNASMVILNFSLQFLLPDDKQIMINNIYKGLQPGGILILSEKFNFEDKKIDKLLSEMHHDFKRSNGYSELEIFQKFNLLKNVMFTDSINTHKLRLKKAGFNHIELYFQYINFGSLIAFKEKIENG